MIGQLLHRGPDGTGELVDGSVGLAHARLSIIDIAGGAQPIHNEDRSVWVVFNGEIFNYVELRRDLEARGHRFYTHSDTEVIVHLYEDHGDDFVQHLNGQFAIALWDARARRLLLARDRTGIRPLFHTEARGRFLFASEVKALFALPEVERRLDARALAEICTYWSPLAPRTIFAGVSSLPPGHVMVIADGRQQVHRYWDWQFPEPSRATQRSEAEHAEELRALLIDATRLQLRADVPVGAYLSGGLDSSIVTSVVRNFTDTPLRTFSLTFEDEEFDESAYQRELVSYLGTEHTSLRWTRADIAAAFPRTIFHAETPIVRTAPAPLMLLSGHVRDCGYKVVLTGEGADEVFGGYDIFKEAKVRRFWARSPDSASRPRILERLYPCHVADIKVGRSRYALLLNERGHVMDDGMILRDDETRFTLTFTSGGASNAEMWIRDWIDEWGLRVHVLDRTMSLAAINVTGPLAGELLRRAGLAEPPRFLGHVRADVAGVPCHVMRLSFTGEAAWELHHPVDGSVGLWRALLELGADLGVRPHGLQALFALRLEKGHVIVGMDTDLDSTPRRLGMDWAARMDKPWFIGRAALERTSR